MKPSQIKAEFDWFGAIMKRENARSYLEIGSKYGVSLKMASEWLPKGSKLVSVDTGGHETLLSCIGGLKAAGYEAHLIKGDSTRLETVEEVGLYAPFDCVFIDANHMTEYVEKDFYNYSPMCRLVAFHDVGYRGEHAKIHVPEFWNRIKTQYRHDELCLSPNSHGIGVVWMC